MQGAGAGWQAHRRGPASGDGRERGPILGDGACRTQPQQREGARAVGGGGYLALTVSSANAHDATLQGLHACAGASNDVLDESMHT